MFSIRSTFTDNTRIAFRPKGNRSRSGRWDVAFNRAEGPAVRPALGNALGNGKTTIFLRPNGPMVLLAARRIFGPLGRSHNKKVGVPFRRAMPWAGRTNGPLGRAARARGFFKTSVRNSPRKRRFFGRVFAEAIRRRFGDECCAADRAGIASGRRSMQPGLNIHDGSPCRYACTLLPPCYHGRWPIS